MDQQTYRGDSEEVKSAMLAFILKNLTQPHSRASNLTAEEIPYVGLNG